MCYLWPGFVVLARVTSLRKLAPGWCRAGPAKNQSVTGSGVDANLALYCKLKINRIKELPGTKKHSAE